MQNQKKTSPKYAEVRERAARMVFDHADRYPSQWAAITSIAAKIGCSTQTLTNWVRQAERDRGLGEIGKGVGRGLLLHAMLALDADSQGVSEISCLGPDYSAARETAAAGEGIVALDQHGRASQGSSRGGRDGHRDR